MIMLIFYATKELLSTSANSCNLKSRPDVVFHLNILHLRKVDNVQNQRSGGSLLLPYQR